MIQAHAQAAVAAGGRYLEGTRAQEHPSSARRRPRLRPLCVDGVSLDGEGELDAVPGPPGIWAVPSTAFANRE